MTTLAELRSELLPGARIVAGGGERAGSGGGHGSAAAADRQIAWVRVMKARVPAFDALEPGDLAIVPGPALAILAQAPDAVDSLAAALAAAPSSGVILVEGESVVEPGGPDPLDALAAALAAAVVPAIRLPRTDVQALERSVIGFIVARGAELERQAGLLEARLAELALEGGGAPALVAAVAEYVGRPVALEGARGQPLAVHAPEGASEGPAAVARYHASPRTSVALRLPLPAGPAAGKRGGPSGSLAILGASPVGALARTATSRVAGLLALEMARDEAVRRAGDDARRSEALPGSGPPWIVLLARQRGPATDDDAPDAHSRREAVRRELRLLAPARRMALRGDADSLEIRAVLGVGAASAPDAELPARIAGVLDRTVAISRAFSSPADRPAAEAEARATLEAALALAEPPVIARADRLPVYRMLGGLHNLADGERLARSLLEPLATGRADVRRERLATLRALLDHGGVNEAAAVLGVHRNTVAYRLRRIEGATGWRLSDPELRLTLSIALRLVQEEQLGR